MLSSRYAEEEDHSDDSDMEINDDDDNFDDGDRAMKEKEEKFGLKSDDDDFGGSGSGFGSGSGSGSAGGGEGDGDGDGKRGGKGGKPEKKEDNETIANLCKQMGEISFNSEVFTPPPIYTGSLEGLTLVEHCEKLKNAYDRWFGEDSKKLKFYALAHYVFGLDMTKDYSEEMIDKIYMRLHLELTNLNIAFEHMGVMDTQTSIAIDYQRKFNRMYETLYNARHTLCFAMRGENSRDGKKCNAAPDKYDLFRFQAFNSSDLNSHETLMIYIQRRAAEKRYVKVGDMLLEERKVMCVEEHADPDSEKKEYGTYSYRDVCTIRTFIIRECNPRTNFEMWRAMLEKGNLDKVAKHLAENCEDEQIPDLKRDRTVTAWRNGLWFAEYAAFYHYSRGRLPKEVCAVQFIDQEFDNTDYGDDFMKIPCVVKKILSDQNFTTEEQAFVLGAAFGRLIFVPGKYDRWEIIPFLWGLAGTGKSCLIEACQKLFDFKDVQGVGNNLEKQFGLQDLVGKMLWVANDVKKNFAMDAGDLQTITSLELMSVAVKFKNAISVKWDVPGILAGNEIPRSWTDCLGALERRILLIDFPNSVSRDNQVKVDLENQRSLFYRIITYAYHALQKRCGTKNLWDFSPRRFIEARKIITEHENPLEIFLNSSEVEITKNPVDYVTEDYLKNWFNNFCRGWGHKARWSPEEMKRTLKNKGVKVIHCEKEWPLNQAAPKPIGGSGAVDGPIPKKTTRTDNFYFGIKLISKKPAGNSTYPSGAPAKTGSGFGNGGNFGSYKPH